MEIENKIEERQSNLDLLSAENRVLKKEICRYDNKLSVEQNKLEITTKALEFVESVANARRGSMKDKIESVLSEALCMIYGSNYQVEMIYEFRHNRTALDIEYIKETPDGDVRRALDGSGHGLGIFDVVSVPIRMLVLMGSDNIDKVCFLDEPYHFISDDKIPLVGEFLRTLCDKLQMQVVMSTHHRELMNYADKNYFISNTNNVATLEMT